MAVSRGQEITSRLHPSSALSCSAITLTTHTQYHHRDIHDENEIGGDCGAGKQSQHALTPRRVHYTFIGMKARTKERITETGPTVIVA